MDIPSGDEFERHWKALDRPTRRRLIRIALGLPGTGWPFFSRVPRRTYDPREAALVYAYVHHRLEQTGKHRTRWGWPIDWRWSTGESYGPLWLLLTMGLVIAVLTLLPLSDERTLALSLLVVATWWALSTLIKRRWERAADLHFEWLSKRCGSPR